MKSSVVLAMYIGKSLQRRGKQIGEKTYKSLLLLKIPMKEKGMKYWCA